MAHETPSRAALLVPLVPLVPLGSSLPVGLVAAFGLLIASFGLGNAVSGGSSAVTTAFAAADLALLVLLGALATVGLLRLPTRGLFVIIAAWAACRLALDARIVSLGGRLDVAGLMITIVTALMLAALVALARHRQAHGAAPSGLVHALGRAEQAASLLLVALGLASLGGAVVRRLA